MRYDLLWRTLVRRAIKQGDVDLDAFVDQAAAAGMSADAIQRRLLDDLDNNGPIFGKFFRGVEAAAAKTTTSAYNAGANLGSGLRNLQAQGGAAKSAADRLLALEELGTSVRRGTPEAIQELQDAIAERDERMWVAELSNTCHRCLPLHGTVMTMQEWTESGWDPDTIHDGWESECQCSLVPINEGTRVDRTTEMGPLVRNKLETATGLSGRKRTARSILQADVDKALAARDKAMQSAEGRRTLRLLGASRGIAGEGETNE